MDINYYLGRIENDKCVLFLGPEFPFLLNDQNRHEIINRNLKNDNSIAMSQYEEDDFFFFKNPASRYRTYAALNNLYEKLGRNELYDQLVQLPFSLIISLSPDWYYKESFEHIYGNDRLKTLAYKKQTSIEIEEKPSFDFPVLFNLFGDIKDEDSLILSFDDLYDFFNTLFSIKLPDTIQTKLDRATDFIFIGFKYNAWYLKLLFRLLKIHNSVNHCFHQEDQVHDQLMLFYKEHFKFEYPGIPTKAFIIQLHESLEKANKLRGKEITPELDKQELIKLITQNELTIVIDHLVKKHSDNRQVIMFANQYTNLMGKIHSRVLTTNDVEFAEFIYRLLSFVQGL